MDRVSPDVSVFGHFLHDVLPYLLCCKAGIFSDCGEYYNKRPSDNGIDFSPPPPPRKKQLHLCNIYSSLFLFFTLQLLCGETLTF